MCVVQYCTVAILAALPKALPSQALTRGYRLCILYCTDGVAAVTDADQIRTLVIIFNNEACGMKLPLLSRSSAAPMGREEDAAPHDFLVGCVWSSCFTLRVLRRVVGTGAPCTGTRTSQTDANERKERITWKRWHRQSRVHVRIQRFRALFGRLGKTETETKAPAGFFKSAKRG